DGGRRMVSAEDIDACAADWLAHLDRPGVSASVHEAFEAWCRADPRHLAAYLRLLEVWNRLDALKACESPVAGTPAAATSVPDSPSRAPYRPPLRRRFFLAAALAASLVATAVGIVWWQRS